MNNPTINKAIEINTSPNKVWTVFTDPAITKQMGGEYVTDWKIGSLLGWKGQNGTMYTNGIILQIEPQILLKHSLLDLNDNNVLLSIITYQFEGNKNKTILSAKEELNYPLTESQIKNTSEGWDFALNAVKEIAERL